MFIQYIDKVVSDEFTIAGHEVIEGEVKPTGNGAHVLVPRDWLGADVKIVRTSESNDNA